MQSPHALSRRDLGNSGTEQHTMRVFYHSSLTDEELVAGHAFFAVPIRATLALRSERNESPYELLYNGTLIDPDTHDVPCNGRAELTIAQDGRRYVYSVHPAFSPLSSRYAKAYEQFSYDLGRVSPSTVQGIEHGDLRLYAMDQSVNVRDYSEIFVQIESAYAAFKAICNRPKSHLKAANEIRPIETVKRVGYESIPYLAAHSEDWLARTASGLRPARLFSRVEEDDYQIYENRLTKTLIDLILSFLRRVDKELRDQRDQLRGIVDSNVQMESFGFDASFSKAVNELLSTNGEDVELRTKSLDQIERLQKNARFLLRRYRALRQTKLYRYLRKAKPVSNPINTTNILLMDRYYSVIFRLWKELHGAIAPRVDDAGSDSEHGKTCVNYQKFCSVLCEYAAHTLGFEPRGDESYRRANDHIEMRVNTTEEGWVKVDLLDIEPRTMDVSNGLEIPIQPNEGAHGFSFDGKCLTWPNDISNGEIESFCSMFKTRASRGRQQADEKRRYMELKKAIDVVQRAQVKPKEVSFTIIPMAVELTADTRSSFRKEMACVAEKHLSESTDGFVVIALPTCNENEQKVTDYAFGDIRAARILPLSMFDINSFRRVQNLMYGQILKLDKKRCPSCGGEMTGEDGRYRCEACYGLMLTHTTCPNPECRRKYYYMGYDAAPNTIKRMRVVTPDDFFQWDSLFQYKNIVEMRVSPTRVRPVCPYCHQ